MYYAPINKFFSLTFSKYLTTIKAFYLETKFILVVHRFVSGEKKELRKSKLFETS